MDLKEAFKKREEEVREYGLSKNNEHFARYGVLVERLTEVALNYLHEEGVDGKVDGDLICGVYFAYGWSLARFVKVLGELTGADTGEIAKNVLALCLQEEDLDEMAIAAGKEGS